MTVDFFSDPSPFTSFPRIYDFFWVWGLPAYYIVLKTSVCDLQGYCVSQACGKSQEVSVLKSKERVQR